MEGVLEAMSDFLVLMIVQSELNLRETLGVLEAEVHRRNNPFNTVFMEFLNIMGEVESTDPDRSQVPLARDDFLSVGVASTAPVHLKHYITLMGSSDF